MMEKCFHAFVLLLIVSFPETQADQCTSGEVKIDTTCPTNCSQEQSRIPGEQVFFKCSIGAQKAVDRYRESHKEDFLPESAVFDAPMVRGVELYWKSYDDGKHLELALKFNFSLPKGILVRSLPRAVLLKFESIPGPNEDCYYVKNPREKIYEFEFHPIHAYDMVNPRQLQEDCLVGLDQMKTALVYNITLQTAEGKLASYITTVHVRDTSPTIWKPVIMAFLNETNASLFVVVEKPPPIHNIQTYNVSLVDGQNKALRSVEIKVHDANTTTFVNLSNISGQCRIMVRPLCKGNCNRQIDVPTLSYRIMLPGVQENKKDSPDYLDDSLKPMKVVAIVMGCTFGVILVLTVIYFIRPKRKESIKGIRPYCLLLHPFERNCEAVIKLKEYITQTCDCAVTDCMDLYQNSGGETEKMTANRARNHLRDATVFLVLYASDFYNRNATSFHTDFLSCFIKSAMNQRQKHNDIRIILLQFPSITISELPPMLTKNQLQLSDLTNNPNKLYSKLNGLETTPINGDYLRTRHNHSQWQEVIAALKNMVRRDQNNVSVAQGEVEPLIAETNEQNDHDELYKLEHQDLLAEIARMNTENDSVIGSLDRDSPQQRLGSRTNEKNNTTAETSIKGRSENMVQSGYPVNYLNRVNVQLCEAEVHCCGESNAKSVPLDSTRPKVIQDQPLSMPPGFTCDRPVCIPAHRRPVCINSHVPGHRELEHLRPNHSEGNFYEFRPCVGHRIGNRHFVENYSTDYTSHTVDQQSPNHGFCGGHQPEIDYGMLPNRCQHHRQMYTDALPCTTEHLNGACGQSMNDFRRDQRPIVRKINFNALDHHETKQIGPLTCFDVNTKHEKAKQNTEDSLKVSSSVQSLPTDLTFGALCDAEVYNNFLPPDDLHRDSPKLQQESESGSQSSIMNQLAAINKNNR